MNKLDWPGVATEGTNHLTTEEINYFDSQEVEDDSSKYEPQKNIELLELINQLSDEDLIESLLSWLDTPIERRKHSETFNEVVKALRKRRNEKIY